MGCCKSSLVCEKEKTTEVFFEEEFILKKAEVSNKVFGELFLDMDTRPMVSMRQGLVKDFYTNIQLLAEGGFGKVYQAVCKQTGENRAIKSLMKSLVTQTTHLFTEVMILRLLDHPNILRVLEIIETPRYFHIISELCEGGELFERMTSAHTLTETTAANYFGQLLSALSHCHSQGIVHRDIKPENLVFRDSSPDSSLVVIDFGMSSLASPNQLPKKACGTHWYAAPETVDGTYSPASDIWSCGIILYLMLSGAHPFPKSHQPLSFDGSAWEEISFEAKQLIRWMLDSDPAKRPTAKEALNSSWIQQCFHKRDRKVCVKSLKRLSHFRRTSRLSHATLEFMVAHYTRNNVLVELQHAFVAMDVNGDGSLTLEELQEAVHSVEMLEIDVLEILRECDANGNGIIEYREFLTAAANKCITITNEKLEYAFKAFDRDGNGVIDVEELRYALGSSETPQEEPWELLLSELDFNGDGVIDIEEFKTGLLDQDHQLLIDKFVLV